MTKRALPAHVYDKKGVLYFQRRGWPTVRISAAAGTPEFALEYAALLNGARTLPVDSVRNFNALVADYVRSPRYRKLAQRTAKDYDKVLEWTKSRLGTLPVSGMQRKDVIRARDANAETLRFANYIVQVLRILFEHAHDLGWRNDNPAKGVSLLKSERAGREPWPSDKIEAFRAAAGEHARLIFELCLGTGQRIGDVLKMRWSDVAGDGINVVQGKTGAVLWVPFTRQLRAVLSSTPKIGVTICAQGRGKPTTYSAASHRIMFVRKEIGAEAYDIHSLRYSAAAELAEAGCSDELIAAVTGHATAAMVRKYSGPIRQKVRAIEAQERRK